jgi:probable HAF family extracellular repeat protein
MTDLGSISGFTHSSAADINNAGQIVGEVFSGGGSRPHAFVYTDGSMLDLNTLIDPTSGWLLLGAMSINDSGQIASHGLGPTGTGRAFLLTPIPEPACAAAIWVMSAGVLLRRRRLE